MKLNIHLKINYIEKGSKIRNKVNRLLVVLKFEVYFLIMF